jgi:hypothetical protein
LKKSSFFRKGYLRASWACLLAFVACICGRAESTNHFGFTGPEIFPIDPMISHLRVADLDNDGLNDLVVVNNSRSKIDLLYNQTGKTNQPWKQRTVKRELNELPPDARFHIESVASEKRIAALVVEDLNGDRLADLAYYGEPKELVVHLNQGSNTWATPKRWAIDDGQLSPNAMTTGDLNGDGLTDLLLLGENCVYVLFQETDHTLREPQKLPFSGNVKSVQAADVDGDGRQDLLLVNWEDKTPFRFRLQKGNGELGPELYFSYPSIRSYWADNLEQNRKTQVMTIAQNSGRAQVCEFEQKPAEPLSGCFFGGQFQVLPLSRTEKARRGLLWADVNGDGLPDLLVAEPENGQLSIQLQTPDGSLGEPKKFPTLAGVSELAVADWDGDGVAEIFMLSADERQVGVTQLENKARLPFPELLPIDGKPLVMAVGTLRPGTKPVLVTIVDQDGKRSLQTRTADGKTTSQKLDDSFKSNPTALAFHDVDQDGNPDLVVLTPYEKVKILRSSGSASMPARNASDRGLADKEAGGPGKDFEEIDVAPPGGALEQPWLSTADMDGDGKPELLLTQKNFVRAVVLKRDGRTQNGESQGWAFSVKEQINGATSSSRLAGAAALSNATNGTSSLFLLDTERKALTLCERDRAGVWQVVRNVPLPISEFSSLRAVALGSTNNNALALLGLNLVAFMPLQGQVWDLAVLDSYETPIKDGRLNDVVSGDLDNDGRKDLVFLETARNYLDLVIFDARHKLIPANRWQVFEERTFRNRRSDLPEPREAAVADVTGDHKNDLVVLVHDRILVYPQE